MKSLKYSVFAVLVSTGFATAKPPAANTASTEVASAAITFLSSLSPEQRESATFEWEDTDTREDWHYFPKERVGLYLSAMTPEQKENSRALLRATMSAEGFRQAESIMLLEQVLRDGGGDPEVRDPAKYAFSIFGKPGDSAPWGWRVEGHHLSINVVIAGGQVVGLTPSFFGTNPAEVRKGKHKGMRVLGADEDAARALAVALVADGFSGTIFSEKPPREIVTRAERTVSPLKEVGVAAGDLPALHQESLRKLVAHFTHRYRHDVADAELAAIDAAGFEKIHFGWGGSTTLGEPCYFRIQGPTFLMEYANTQGGANHAHAVWRDFDGDFGRDVLAEHLKSH